MADRPTAIQLPYTLADVAREKESRAGNKIRTYFPDDGPYRRELYPKHVAFMNRGSEYRERAFIAGNRCGKTVTGAFETTCHLTGEYPHWWQGKRFTKATRGWVGGDTGKTLREIVQHELLGPLDQEGTGMIPRHMLHHRSMRGGTAGAVDTIYVKHTSGGLSTLTLKAYEEGRKSFQGAGLDFVWLDEEPPHTIYVECLLRLTTTAGVLFLTFTPLEGWTTVIDEYMSQADRYSPPSGEGVILHA